MLHSHYRWTSLIPDKQAAAKLEKELRISPMLASLLATRGYDDPEQAAVFLRAGEEVRHGPFELYGMKEAVARIRSALNDGEKILVYGDYDADGVSSTALMILLLTRLKANFEWYIPHRSKEGYGLHNHALEEAAGRGVSLVVTVDTGISAVGQIAYAKSLGLDVVVTDHHEPPSVLPEACALVNPKLPFCGYPFKGLAGVGVAYKLACALLGEVPEEWLQLVALGTVADLMPLSGENRSLVSAGLSSMAGRPITGLGALLRVAGSTAVNSTTVGFALAPRINAGGRLTHAREALELLIATDPDLAEQAAERLDLLNRERQQIVDDIVREAELRLNERTGSGGIPPVIVVAGEGWNVGVVGIVASKLLEKYYRPVVILGIDAETGMCKGSARSIPGYDIYAALTESADVLDHFGGHPSAAGMALHRDKLEAFEQRLIAVADQVLTSEHFIPTLTADLECSLQELSLEAIEQLARLEPFGMGNGSPRFLIRGARVVECRQMGKDRKHLKITLKQNGSLIEAVAFGKGPLASLISAGASLDLVAEAGINEWNGSRKPQLMLLDAAVPHLQVFDYRGISPKADKLENLRREWSGLPSQMTGQACVVCRESSGAGLSVQLQELPVWVYDRSIGLKKVNRETGLVCRPEEVTSLLIMDFPETLRQLDELVESFVSVERIYLLHSIPDEKDRVQPPSREQFIKVYTMLRKAAAAPALEAELFPWLQRQVRLSERMLSISLDVFEELNFISRDRGMVIVNPAPKKAQLESSVRYQELNRLAEMEHYLLDAEALQLVNWFQALKQNVS